MKEPNIKPSSRSPYAQTRASNRQRGAIELRCVDGGLPDGIACRSTRLPCAALFGILLSDDEPFVPLFARSSPI